MAGGQGSALGSGSIPDAAALLNKIIPVDGGNALMVSDEGAFPCLGLYET